MPATSPDLSPCWLKAYLPSSQVHPLAAEARPEQRFGMVIFARVRHARAGHHSPRHPSLTLLLASCRSIHNRFDLPYVSRSALARELHEACADRGGCAGAVEWLADAAEQAGGEHEAARAAFEELKSIDPIRRLYVYPLQNVLCHSH